MAEKVTTPGKEYTNVLVKMPKPLKIRLERFLTYLYETKDVRQTQAEILEVSLDKYLKKFGY